jgi:hypothetical protein
MTQFPCPRCKAILTADEQQAQVSCSQCQQLIAVPSGLPDWASAPPAEGLPDWLAAPIRTEPRPAPRKDHQAAPEPVALREKPAVPERSVPQPPPLPAMLTPPAAHELPMKWIAAGAAAVVGLLALTVGVFALAGNRTANANPETPEVRLDRDGAPAQPNLPIKEIGTTPRPTPPPSEPPPTEKPRPPAESAELLPSPLPFEPSAEKTSPAPTPAREPIVRKKPPKEEEEDELPPPPKMTTIAAKPRELSPSIKAGVAFLAKQQNPDGGWSGGEMGVFLGGPFGKPAGARPAEQASDPANTSIAALALIRAGYSPRQGNHSAALRKAIDYVCKAVEKSKDENLSLTIDKVNVALGRGGFKPGAGATRTLVQTKIGPSVDTYLAGLLLAEARGKMPDAASEKRVYAALKKIQQKLEAHQKEDGTWGDNAWAPVLGQALASRALNRAGQVGLPVDNVKLQRAAKHARTNLEKGGKGGKGLIGAAGIALYAVASGIGGLHDAAITRKQAAEGARGIVNSPTANDNEKTQARQQIQQAGDSEKVFLDALRSVAKQVNNPNFVRGFGTDGGEEFLSFVLIGEALRSRLPTQWSAWDKAIRNRLTRAQNRDGSWAGSHCITGKVFCTATAVMAMMTERAPVPAAAEEK